MILNSDTKVIQKSVEINAPKEKVWEVLLQDKFTRQWYAAFSEGTYAITDWQVGSKAIFTDAGNNGLIGKIIENRPYELLTIEYTGHYENGQEIYEGEMADALKGGHETYRLTETAGITRLSVELDMDPKYYEMMVGAWDKALLLIKDLAEENITASN